MTQYQFNSLVIRGHFRLYIKMETIYESNYFFIRGLIILFEVYFNFPRFIWSHRWLEVTVGKSPVVKISSVKKCKVPDNSCGLSLTTTVGDMPNSEQHSARTHNSEWHSTRHLLMNNIQWGNIILIENKEVTSKFPLLS